MSWNLRWRSPPDTDLAVGVGRRPRHHLKKGTAVTKKYQIKDATTNDALGLAVPAAVNMAMNEISADMREGCSPWLSVLACRSCSR